MEHVCERAGAGKEDGMAELYVMLIRPRYVETIWGGHTLATKLGKDAPADRAVGESWEIYEKNAVANGPLAGRTIGELRALLGPDLMGHVAPENLFPLLTKLIDAQDVLSVQVHPDDRFARAYEQQPYGKTECWYIIDVAPGATLTYGFRQDTSPDEYTRLVAEGALERLLRPLEVRPGDVVYLPAGTVHAIGRGIVLYEVQQTSELTYRIYDWNRRDAQGKARELHVEKARRVLDYHRCTRGVVHPLARPGSGRAMLVAGQYFCLELLEAGKSGELSTMESPVALCSLEQPVAIQAGSGGEQASLAPYSSALIPAAAGSYRLVPRQGTGAGARVLATYVPRSAEHVAADLRARGFEDGEIGAFLAQFAPARDLGQPATG
jgi:mannose-6-phosphate isomerase